MDRDENTLLLGIYDCIASPARWPGVLDDVAGTTGALGMILYELAQQDNVREIVPLDHSSIYPRPVLAQYVKMFRPQELEENDLVERRAQPGDEIEVIRDTDLFDDAEALSSRPNVRALSGFDIRHRAFGLLDKDFPGRARFSISHTGAHGPLRDDQRDRLGRLLPHIAKALDLGRPAAMLARLNASLLAAMDRLRVGVAILDSAGRLVAENAEFARQRETHGALRLDRSGVLEVGDGVDARQLHALRESPDNNGRHGARPRKEAVAVSGADGPGALCIEVAPLARVDEIGTRPLDGAVVYSLDTTLPFAVDTGPAALVFGLTEAESLLAGLVTEGLTNAQIAERRERSVETVNAQVKTLLAKTGCANRTQLVRMLVGQSARFLSDDG